MEYIKETYDLTNVESYKRYLIEVLDKDTERTIAEGFSFDGIVFSLSIPAQMNISNIPNIPEAAFPFPYSGKEEEPYQLTYANAMNFYLTALNTVKTKRIANGAVKTQVKACTTIAELDALRATIPFA